MVEYLLHATPNRCHENLADLQADEERKGHDDGRKGSSLVISRLCELEVEEGEQGGEIGDEGRAHGKDGTDEAVVYESIDAAVFHRAVKSKWVVLSEGRTRETYVQVSFAAGMYALP